MRKGLRLKVPGIGNLVVSRPESRRSRKRRTKRRVWKIKLQMLKWVDFQASAVFRDCQVLVDSLGLA